MSNPIVNGNGNGTPVYSVIENKSTFGFCSGEKKNDNLYNLDKFYRYVGSFIKHESRFCLSKNVKNIINKINDERELIKDIPVKYLRKCHYERPIEIYKEYINIVVNFDHSKCNHNKISTNTMFLETLNYLKDVIIDNNCAQQEHNSEKREPECVFGFGSKKRKTTDFGKMNIPEPVKQKDIQIVPPGSIIDAMMHSMSSMTQNPFGPQAPKAPSVPSVPSVPSAPSVPSVPSATTGSKQPVKDCGSSSVPVPCIQKDRLSNLDSSASLKLNFNLDHAVRGIVVYHAYNILNGLQNAIQYLNNELENAKTRGSPGVPDPCEQQGSGTLNINNIASLKLNSNLDFAIRAIVDYRISKSLDSLQKAIQYLNNELKNNKTN